MSDAPKTVPAVTITCSVEQAQAIAEALEVYMRLGIGQMGIVAELVRDGTIPMAAPSNEPRREAPLAICNEITALMATVKSKLGHSYGASNPISHRHTALPVSRAYQVMKHIRHALVWHRKPEGGFGVYFDDPNSLNYTGEAPPVVEIKQAESGA